MMNIRKIDSPTIFAPENRPLSLVFLIDNMNLQYSEYKTRTGHEASTNWTLEKKPANAEGESDYYQIECGKFYRSELWNFLVEKQLKPELRIENHKFIINIYEENLKNTKATQRDAGHFLFEMHKKINELVAQENQISCPRPQ